MNGARRSGERTLAQARRPGRRLVNPGRCRAAAPTDVTHAFALSLALAGGG